MFRDSIVLSVVSQQSNLWRNVSCSTDQQKTFVRNFWDFLYTLKMRLKYLEADVTSYDSGVVRIEIVVQKRCFYQNINLHNKFAHNF